MSAAEPQQPRPPLAAQLIQELEGWRRAGVTHWPHPASAAATADDVESQERGADTAQDAPPATQTSPTDRSLEHQETAEHQDAVELQETSDDRETGGDSRHPSGHAAPVDAAVRLKQLADCVASCQKCSELASTRTQTVFGVGNPSAEILFIGEAPGADEDRLGEPFVGRAGQLLNDIIAACRLTRDELYICNILRCRPPGNRNPTSDETANCREFLDGQISIVRPSYIVCWGSVAAQSLLNTQTTIGRLRGKFYEYAEAKVLCTYHPSYLLRNPAAKVHVWNDMKFLMRDLGVDLESGQDAQ